MQAVHIMFEPGKKGGRKSKVYYCSSCFSAARSRAHSVSELQRVAIDKVKTRLKREKKGEKRNAKAKPNAVDSIDPVVVNPDEFEAY